MRNAPTASATLLVLTALVSCAPAQDPPAPEMGEPLAGLTEAELARFEAGKTMFTRVWLAEEGLGPVYNENSCNACHSDPVPGGGGEETDEKITTYSPHGGCDLLAEEGGGNVRQQATALAASQGITEELGPEGSRGYFTPPLLYGRGLMEAISDETLLALADPDDQDGDGISGRVGRDSAGRVGRFLRKASVASLHEAAEGSVIVELGLTTPFATDERVFVEGGVPPAADPTPDPEVGVEVAEAMADFMRFLAPPPQSFPDDPAEAGQAREGRRTFDEIGCAACHTPVLMTDVHEVEALSRKPAPLYSDLLLHDMGSDLADICGPGADPSELRTEVLMGLSVRTLYMHDGASSTLWDAIARHGGEGDASREAFDALPELRQHAVIRFLNTL